LLISGNKCGNRSTHGAFQKIRKSSLLGLLFFARFTPGASQQRSIAPIHFNCIRRRSAKLFAEFSADFVSGGLGKKFARNFRRPGGAAFALVLPTATSWISKRNCRVDRCNSRCRRVNRYTRSSRNRAADGEERTCRALSRAANNTSDR
jgi:hypothetical protein